jgi:hypothetical protein
MRGQPLLTVLICLLVLAGCAVYPSNLPTAAPAAPPSQTFSATPTRTSTPTPSPTPTATFTPSLTPTEKPLTLIFYGDSVLKVGDVSRQGEVGFSIVDIVGAALNPADQIITSNHGGRKAQWGYENLDKNVLIYHPNLVTLWWGLNDLGGCPGIFDRATNRMLQYELDAYLALHLKYMQLQIEALLAK